jgi:hypothetical protein
MKANRACVGVPAGQRVEQGESTWTPNECLAHDYCWDSNAEPACFTRAA